MSKLLATLPCAALAFMNIPAVVHAQGQPTAPSLAPMPEAQVRELPADMRRAPAPVQTGETVTTQDGVETITRTRRIEAPRPAPPAPEGYARGYAPSAYAPPAYAPVVFEREQWLDECRRRTEGQDKDDTGLIIGGLLGAIAGGVAGYEIAGAGDRVLGTVLGVGGGGLIGGLIGSLFKDDDEKRYDCEAALDAYLSEYGAPGNRPATRIASREIAGPGSAYGYGYPAAYPYGYGYAPQQQVVLIPVRTEVQQQVVVRESVREETYTVPGAARNIPDPAPRTSAKTIKQP